VADRDPDRLTADDHGELPAAARGMADGHGSQPSPTR
jgi:hypothetical protein